MKRRIGISSGRTRALLAVTLVCLMGCANRIEPTQPSTGSGRYSAAGLALPGRTSTTPSLVADQNDPPPPSGLVSVTAGGETRSIWPYTGASFDGVPSDPVSLIFLGDVDPTRIRAALFALDGNRASFGFPSAAPFNQTWSDAIGDVQTAYTETAGWRGSVVQLALGDYGPIRVHLRLFTGGGGWTLGAAHFEVLIPGTPEHQVLSWMLARDLVVADLVRSGLLSAPPSPTAPISATPTFRAIPEVIYNGLPADLKAIVGGPSGNASAPVPLASDGRAVILSLTGVPGAAAGTWTQQFSLPFGQAIPKPLCSDGPLDWVYVQGTVGFQKTVTVSESGRYEYQSSVSGQVTVTPIDVTQSPPTPSGASFTATVSDLQEGFLGSGGESAAMRSKRIAHEQGGAELLMTSLRVSSPGPAAYRLLTQCLAP
jgi:hypothetical protein